MSENVSKKNRWTPEVLAGRLNGAQAVLADTAILLDDVGASYEARRAVADAAKEINLAIQEILPEWFDDDQRV